MFYRRKFYTVVDEFVAPFNELFNNINLPNQLKHGTRFVGRWSMPLGNGTSEVFAIWEYDSKDEYERIEHNIRNDKAHVQRIVDWYQKHGGRERIFSDFILTSRNEEIFDTVLATS